MNLPCHACSKRSALVTGVAIQQAYYVSGAMIMCLTSGGCGTLPACSQVKRKVETNGSPMVAQAVPRVQMRSAGAGPKWVVLDGPLGTPASEVLSPLIMSRLKHQGANAQAVLGLRQGCRVIWECSSLASAPPALLAAVPVLHVGQPLQVSTATWCAWFTYRALQVIHGSGWKYGRVCIGAAHLPYYQVLCMRYEAIRHLISAFMTSVLLGGEAEGRDSLMQFPVAYDWLCCDVQDDGSMIQAGVFKALRLNLNNTKAAAALSRPAVQLMMAALTRYDGVIRSKSVGPASEHGGHPSIVRTLVDLFSEVVRTLEIPHQVGSPC